MTAGLSGGGFGRRVFLSGDILFRPVWNDFIFRWFLRILGRKRLSLPAQEKLFGGD